MLGVCYYPEHWEKERIEKDLDIMVKNGIEIIRIGEFMWSVLEKSEDDYDFSLLEEVFKISKIKGLKVILGTPTAAPPPWMAREFPEILQKDERFIVRPYGARGNFCRSSKVFIKKVKKLVDKLAKRFGEESNLYAWQIDNEFGNENNAYCYCEKCDKKFVKFLKEKYEDISYLNSAWGTRFWSQEYNSFDQIDTPKKMNAAPNPHQVLDFYRFSSWNTDSFAKQQIDIIKKYSDKPITHNFLINFTLANYKKHSELYDFVSYDNYMPVFIYDPMIVAFNQDLMYSLLKKEFIVMEQQPGRVNWQIRNKYFPAEWLRPATIQTLLHGAKDVVYFRYRALPYGPEQYHNGIVNYHGEEEGSPRLKVVKEISQEIKELEKRPQAGVAIYFDYENAWMNRITNISKDFDYMNSIIEIYTALRKNGHFVDIVFKDDDFTKYDTLIVPFALYIDEIVKEKIERFEGRLFINSWFDMKNENSHFKSDKIFGVDFFDLKLNVLDFGAVDGDILKTKDNVELKTDYWLEEIKLIKGNVFAYWKEGQLKGKPAIISSADDRILYCSTVLDSKGYLEIFKKWFNIDLEIPDQLEIVGNYIINFSNVEKTIFNKKISAYSILHS